MCAILLALFVIMTESHLKFALHVVSSDSNSLCAQKQFIDLLFLVIGGQLFLIPHKSTFYRSIMLRLYCN